MWLIKVHTLHTHFSGGGPLFAQGCCSLPTASLFVPGRPAEAAPPTMGPLAPPPPPPKNDIAVSLSTVVSVAQWVDAVPVPHSLHWCFCRPCWQWPVPALFAALVLLPTMLAVAGPALFAPVSHSLHICFCRPCWQWPVPHSLHQCFSRPCWQWAPVPHSLHICFCQPLALHPLKRKYKFS
jgi:hypothetical protein